MSIYPPGHIFFCLGSHHKAQSDYFSQEEDISASSTLHSRGEGEGTKRNFEKLGQGSTEGRCFLQNEGDSHCSSIAQTSFAKKHTRNELRNCHTGRGRGGGTSQTLWEQRGAMGGLFLSPPLVFASCCWHRCDSRRKTGRRAGDFWGAHHRRGRGELLSERGMAKLPRSQKNPKKKNPTASKLTTKPNPGMPGVREQGG